MARCGDGIYQRGKSKTWYLDTVINRKRHQIRLGKGITRTVAKELAQIERAKILKGEAGIGGKKRKDVSFEEARQKFEDWAKATKKRRTQHSYLACLDELAKAFGDKRLSEITVWDLEKYRKERSEGKELIKPSTPLTDAEWERRCRMVKRGAPIRVNRELAVLKTLFNRCKDWDLYDDPNPVNKVRFKREEQKTLRFLDLDEEARLLAKTAEPLRSIILLGIHTGLRIEAEALTLKWNCVDFNRGIMTVEAAYAKNGRTRPILLNSIAFRILKQLKATATSEYVFVTKHGTPYHGLGSSFRRARNRAGLSDVTPHTLRHTFASRMVMAGVDLRTVQELAGWSDLRLVMRYAHLAPQHKAKAIERLVEF